MPLNRLENFIKNIEGRILYVNPNDLDSTDSISNDGNSLAQPFKTIQRALIESARFSYVTGRNNDRIERTTILVYPGEHVIDNRPGFAIKPSSGNANIPTAVAPAGGETTPAASVFSLTLNSNFDLTQEDNILYKYNSVNGGVVVPRGTSLVGLDLRKTKIRPKYVPNPTDSTVPNSALFRITGTCYFWQFSIFDGDKSGTVYTNNKSFNQQNDTSTPLFSHHKLTCFEYADGVNKVTGYNNTDLEMYYDKLSNAFNESAAKKVIPVQDRYPLNPEGFAPRLPEFEIVGAFASDPIQITSIKSGNGVVFTQRITVTTSIDHGLNVGTPVQIKGVVEGTNSNIPYNTSSLVQEVISDTQFTYLARGDFSAVSPQSGGSLSVSNAFVTVETDTVEGASPYIFNCSLRSVYGMNGMIADGSKATGFRSMVVAQFTGISLQKDDRAFVKYNKSNRTYEGISLSTITTGSQLAAQSSALDVNKVYHLDSDAIYRAGWETTHVSITNDAILQIVSVFAIGYNKHFGAETGGDASITNSNSNFGQLSLSSDGFKAEAFEKDNTALITSIITPRSITGTAKTSGESTTKIDWFKIDAAKTRAVGINSHLYVNGFINDSDAPPTLTAGYRVGARGGQVGISSGSQEILYVSIGKRSNPNRVTRTATVKMVDGGGVGAGLSVYLASSVSVKKYPVLSGPVNNKFNIGAHELTTGESIRIFSDDADLPENLDDHILYYAIVDSSTEIRIASSFTDAENSEAITIYGGSKLSIESRVHDKDSGEIGSPIQFNSNTAGPFLREGNSNVTETAGWYITVDPNNSVYQDIAAQTTDLPDEGTTNVSYVARTEDSRSLDDKVYKMRVVVPKEVVNGKNPEESFVIQDSSTTGARTNADFSLTSITTDDWEYGRNPRFISTCTVSSNLVTVLTDLPHNLNVNDKVTIKNVTSSNNTAGVANSAYNGVFSVNEIVDSKSFKYPTTDVDGLLHTVGTFTNDVTSRTTDLPRFEISDVGQNYYIYKNETITPYIEGIQDGIYHVFVLNAGNVMPEEFTDLKYSQNVADLYPQTDRDNINSNPSSTVSTTKRSPLGDVATNYLKDSLTRESTDKFIKDFGLGNVITTVSDSGTSATLTFDRGHNYNAIIQGTITAGSAYITGTHQNVKLLKNNSDPSVGTWAGATARVIVTGGAVSSVEIIAKGGGYSSEALYFDQTRIGAGNGAARYTITSTGTDIGIANNVGDVVQVTGIGTKTDGYYKIATVPNHTQISIAKSIGDPTPYAGQYVFDNGPSVNVGSTTLSDEVLTLNTSTAHGLVIGNSFRVLNSSNERLGDFVVSEVSDVDTIKAVVGLTNISGSSVIYKLGMDANNALSDKDGENLGTRGLSFYDKETLKLVADCLAAATTINVALPTAAGIGTMTRFPLGSYIQIGNEIMRVSSSTLSGSSNNEISVIRGALGTIKSKHLNGAVVKKIKPLPVEFRRPSILRASGHTFEYVGYGPGNYSTGLPQVQVKTLDEREEFLTQSQERSCGTVVYTGMNNRGDFFIGNKKINSSTGQERTFDSPIPTVTGEDPARLSVVFDEVIVKERINVEGGKSNKILSTFDGPVTFNGDIKCNGDVTFNGDIKFTGNAEFESISLAGANFESDVTFEDDVYALFGDDKDLKIGHSGTASESVIEQVATATGNLKIKDAGVTRLEVAPSGLVLSGISTFSDDVEFTGASYNALWDKSTDSLHFNDLAEATFGNTSANPDLKIYHDTTDSFLTNNTGTLKIKGGTSSGQHVELYAGSNVAVRAVNAVGAAAAQLMCNGATKLQTADSGVTITGDLDVTLDITAFSTSDKRLKDNIVPIPNALDKVVSISGNTFDWNEASGKKGSETGVIAQEVEELELPGVTSIRDDGTHAVRYEKLVPLLIEAIKELKNEVDELKKGK